MNSRYRSTVAAVVTVVAILALMLPGIAHAQRPQPPAPATPFDGVPAFGALAPHVGTMNIPAIGSAFLNGGGRLATLQNPDGGWKWYITDGPGSPPNIIGPVGMGLGKAYEHTGDAAQLTALANAGAFLLTKSGNFSPSDGYLAAELDSVFGGTTYRDYVKANFYDLLAAGTYQRTGDSTFYDTAAYVNRIRTVRASSGIGNLAAWDVGIGLVGASMAGVTGPDLDTWIAGTEASINALDGSQYYDVLGLAGGLYGLAFVGQEFDPTSGLASMATNLESMGTILVGYQLGTGGFTWNSQQLAEGVGNETIQETAYSILALSKVNRTTFLPATLRAADYLFSTQLGTGGWEDSVGDPYGENNEITGEALWGLDTGYPVGDVWVCPTGDCGHPDASYNTVQEGVDNVRAGGTVHILAGTYVEQVHINRSITLIGADPSTVTIQSPDALSSCFSVDGSPRKPIICVENTEANIMDLTVDGAGKGNSNVAFLGIAYHNASGTVSGNDIVGVRDTPFDGSGYGVSMYGFNDDAVSRTLHVSGNHMSDYGKNGMAFAGEGLTADVTGNVVTGFGPTALLAQNGIQIGFGAGGTIMSNTVSGNVWTGTGSGDNNPLTDPEADGAAGVLLYGPGAAVEIGGNTLTANQFGIWTVAAPSANIHDNSITGLAHIGNAYPVGIAIWSVDQWASYFGISEAGTVATIANNTIDTNDYGVLILDYTAGAPTPSATATGNTFTHNHIQVASTDGTIDIPATLSGNTFDLAVTVSGSPYLPFIWSHIQDGVNAASSGDIVHVNPGTYVENVTIPTSLEVAGAAEATTIVEPAVSNPNCGGSGGGSLCTGASNVFLVQANNVTIDHLTVDGDNPALTSDYNVGGANLDARNGIITDHTSGTYNGLEVHHVTVRNIYLRGIYDSTGTFNFHDNMVTNVQAEYASIAIFAWYGPGTFENNTVSYANDAISANWSNGIQFLNNTVTHSGSGVHTDNAGSVPGDTADLIQGNAVSDCMTDGYGIFVFVPYIAPTVSNNTITNCQVGLAAFGQASDVTTNFTNNTVTGPSKASGSVGAFITTDQVGYGNNNVGASFSGNSITDFETGVLLTADATRTADIASHCDSIAGNTNGVTTSGAGTLTNDFTHDWWGSALGPTAAGNPTGAGDSAVAGINYSPWAGAANCSTTIPPYPTTTTITSDIPDPSVTGMAVPIHFTVANGLTGGPVPVGTVDVTEGLTTLCSAVALDGSGNGSCSPIFSSAGDHTITATFTATDTAQFDSGSSDTEVHTVVDHLFADVPVTGKEWMEPWINAFYFAGITTGCGTGPLIYCPEASVTRAEMAVFLLRGEHGIGYAPPAASHYFSDLPVTGKEWMEPWIDQFYREGLTTGCGVDPLIYCPEQHVTRAEMAVFVLRTIHIGTPGWTPPAASGFFSDVPVAGKEWMEPWIDEYYREGLTTGCGSSPLIYCPENDTTRAEMAVFIDRAFGITPVP